MKRILESVIMLCMILFCCLTDDSPWLTSAGLLTTAAVSFALIPRGR